MVSADRNMSMPSITVGPKVVFGIDGQVNNSLHLYDEKKLVYIAGNNVVILDLYLKTQSFIAASENAYEINFLTVSP